MEEAVETLADLAEDQAVAEALAEAPAPAEAKALTVVEAPTAAEAQEAVAPAAVDPEAMDLTGETPAATMTLMTKAWTKIQSQLGAEVAFHPVDHRKPQQATIGTN
jgi:hypothetical protein